MLTTARQIFMGIIDAGLFSYVYLKMMFSRTAPLKTQRSRIVAITALTRMRYLEAETTERPNRPPIKSLFARWVRRSSASGALGGFNAPIRATSSEVIYAYCRT